MEKDQDNQSSCSSSDNHLCMNLPTEYSKVTSSTDNHYIRPKPSDEIIEPNKADLDCKTNCAELSPLTLQTFPGFNPAQCETVYTGKDCKNKDSTSENSEVLSMEDYVSTAVYKPVIPLPPLVEVTNIHEGEDVVFKARCKLYHFGEDLDGEFTWFERGLGDLKILQKANDKDKIRIVMWREHVNTVACNHLLQSVEVVKIRGERGRFLEWQAVDHAFYFGKYTLFLAKFVNENSCLKFKDTLDDLISTFTRSRPEVPVTKFADTEIPDPTNCLIESVVNLMKETSSNEDVSSTISNSNVTLNGTTEDSVLIDGDHEPVVKS